MVGGQEQRRVTPQVVAVEIVEQLAEVVVAGRHQRRIVGANLGDFLRRVADLLVHRPVEHAAFPTRLVGLLEFRRRIEGLVRVEALEHHEPVVRAAVEVEEFEAAGEAARQAIVLLVLHELAVDRVLQALPTLVEVIVLRGISGAEALERWLHHRLPRIVFLPANEVPGAEAAVVRGAAVLEVVHVVGDQMRVDSGVSHHLREGVVERLERTPAAVHEIEPTGVQVAACRHARKAADEVCVESHAAAGEAIEIRRLDRSGSIAAERGAHQGIEKDEDGAHRVPPARKCCEHAIAVPY